MQQGRAPAQDLPALPVEGQHPRGFLRGGFSAGTQSKVRTLLLNLNGRVSCLRGALSLSFSTEHASRRIKARGHHQLAPCQVTPGGARPLVRPAVGVGEHQTASSPPCLASGQACATHTEPPLLVTVPGRTRPRRVACWLQRRQWVSSVTFIRDGAIKGPSALAAFLNPGRGGCGPRPCAPSVRLHLC